MAVLVKKKPSTRQTYVEEDNETDSNEEGSRSMRHTVVDVVAATNVSVGNELVPFYTSNYTVINELAAIFTESDRIYPDMPPPPPFNPSAPMIVEGTGDLRRESDPVRVVGRGDEDNDEDAYEVIDDQAKEGETLEWGGLMFAYPDAATRASWTSVLSIDWITCSLFSGMLVILALSLVGDRTMGAVGTAMMLVSLATVVGLAASALVAFLAVSSIEYMDRDMVRFLVGRVVVGTATVVLAFVSGILAASASAPGHASLILGGGIQGLVIAPVETLVLLYELASFFRARPRNDADECSGDVDKTRGCGDDSKKVDV